MLRYLAIKRKGSSGLVLVGTTFIVGLFISILFAFTLQTSASSTIHALARSEAHIILSSEKEAGSGTNDVYCQSFTNMLISNGIISSSSDITGTCSWTISVTGTLPDGTDKLTATLQIPDITVAGETVHFDPVSAYRE